MDIRDKIRETFNKKKLVESPKVRTKWDSDSQPNIYELDIFLRKSGYKLVDVVDSKGSTFPELIIEPIKSGYLHPEIEHDISDNKFYVNVVKYGMLEMSDLEGIIEGYETALGVLRHLGSIDLKKLEIEEDEV